MLAAFFTLKISEYIYRFKKSSKSAKKETPPSPVKPKAESKKASSGLSLIAKIKALFTKKKAKTTAQLPGSDKKKVLKFTATKDFYKEKTY